MKLYDTAERFDHRADADAQEDGTIRPQGGCRVQEREGLRGGPGRARLNLLALGARGAGPALGHPLAAAWAIADKLGTSIDAVVGRGSDPEPEARDLNAFYRSLSEGGRRTMDELAQWLDFRERVLATEGR